LPNSVGTALHQRLQELLLFEDPRRTPLRELVLSRRSMCQDMKFIRERTNRIAHGSLSSTEDRHDLFGE
jgi:hypothetical protein